MNAKETIAKNSVLFTEEMAATRELVAQLEIDVAKGELGEADFVRGKELLDAYTATVHASNEFAEQPEVLSILYEDAVSENTVRVGHRKTVGKVVVSSLSVRPSESPSSGKEVSKLWVELFHDLS